MTLLTPLLFALLGFVSGKMMSLKSVEAVNVKVIDNTGTLGTLAGSGSFSFETVEPESMEILKARYSESVLLIFEGQKGEHPTGCVFYSNKIVSIDLQEYVRRSVNTMIENKKLQQYNIENLNLILAAVRTNIGIKTFKWDSQENKDLSHSDKGKTEQKGKETNTFVVMGLSYVFGFLIYLFVFLFGMMVMRGVIEEKSNRIIEIMVSSVRPFQLMMGKIIGIAMVAFTQFILWIAIMMICYSNLPSGVQNILSSGTNIISPSIILIFILFFIGGYLLYASMYAAIGSMVETEGDTQQISLPVTIPLIFSMVILSHAAQYPSSSLSFWTSMIPFTSPIIMMTRIPSGVPLWEIVVSLAILFGSFLSIGYLAARIYRVGILMYGKKPSLKELTKWFKYK
jgi:ABC-2 type transport system permease protein